MTAYILHLQVGFSLKCSLSGSPDFTKVMIVCENSDVRAPAAASYHMITGYLGPLSPNFHALLQLSSKINA